MALRLCFLAVVLTLAFGVVSGCGDGNDGGCIVETPNGPVPCGTATPTPRVIAIGVICFLGDTPLTPTYCVTPVPTPTRKPN